MRRLPFNFRLFLCSKSTQHCRWLLLRNDKYRKHCRASCFRRYVMLGPRLRPPHARNLIMSFSSSFSADTTNTSAQRASTIITVTHSTADCFPTLTEAARNFLNTSGRALSMVDAQTLDLADSVRALMTTERKTTSNLDGCLQSLLLHVESRLSSSASRFHFLVGVAHECFLCPQSTDNLTRSPSKNTRSVSKDPVHFKNSNWSSRAMLNSWVHPGS